VRLRVKRRGRVEERDEKGWALLSSCVPVGIGGLDDSVVDVLVEEEWEVEGVTLEDVLGDE
jgi:hypothetical protein